MRDTWTTGGDMGSHILYAKLYAEHWRQAPQWHVWLPDVFAGFPFPTCYFPLPYWVIAFLSVFLPFNVAFKIGCVAGAVLMPGAAYAMCRMGGLRRGASALGGVGCLAFLLHEEHSIWGGNLLSMLAGEFSYSYGLAFAFLFVGACVRFRGRWTWVPLLAGLEVCAALSHVIPFLVTGCATLFLAVERGRSARNTAVFAAVHALAFGLLGLYILPLLEMLPFLNPNDPDLYIPSWRELLPATLWPMGIPLVIAAVGACFNLTGGRKGPPRTHPLLVSYLVLVAFTAGAAYLAAPSMGLLDIRFYPVLLLFLSVAVGAAGGLALEALPWPGPAQAMVGLGCLLLGSWAVVSVTTWSRWNFEGLEAKARWQALSEVIQEVRGEVDSPRLVFEHDPANTDIGSTRSLEALPLFTGRPVLEGLFMEAAVLGPAIYQLQSEVSASPSSPLVRYPSGYLDPDAAALHMDLFYADLLLLRSDEAKAQFAAAPAFAKVRDIGPLSIYRLRVLSTHLVDAVVVDGRPILRNAHWKEDAFRRFKERKSVAAPVAVYLTEADMRRADEWAVRPQGAFQAAAIADIQVGDGRITFTTDSPGLPHLVRVAYDPKWRCRDGSPVHLASPGFLLVLPEGRRVELVYGESRGTRMGRYLLYPSVGGWIVFLVVAVVRGHRRPKTGIAGRASPQAGPAVCRQGEETCVALAGAWQAVPCLCLCVAMAGTAIFLHRANPRVLYSRAYELMKQGRHTEAAPLFALAAGRRHDAAGRENSLFWAARSSEYAGANEDALCLYTELVEELDGRWLPESLYRLAALHQARGEPQLAHQHADRLFQEHPRAEYGQRYMKDHALALADALRASGANALAARWYGRVARWNGSAPAAAVEALAREREATGAEGPDSPSKSPEKTN